MSQSSFAGALNEQVANEFAAQQQYIAIAVHYDAETLPRLASFFYRQAVEERNHAMMITQYLLDADLEVTTPGIGAPEVAFAEAELSPLARSFYLESRRVANRRIKEELGVRLAYPDYRAGLEAILAAGF